MIESLIATLDRAARYTLGLDLPAARASLRQPVEAAIAKGPLNALEAAQEWAIDNGVYTDAVLRRGVRALLKTRLEELHKEYQPENVEYYVEAKRAFADQLRGLQELAILTDVANEQHYEVDTEFFRICLGKHMKYSCCLYPEGVTELDDAERAMLELYCERAQIKDGMSIMELGCGWGSLSLFLAQKYPKSRVTGLSNSNSQREYIEAQAQARGLTNLTIITADINKWTATDTFDRVVSIEMFEHMKNYEMLFKKVASLLKNGDSRAFIHVFCHRDLPYHFQTGEAQSWMARYFFSGGTMPARDTFSYFSSSLALERDWAVNGTHYAKTSRAWLERMDERKNECMPWLVRCYGSEAEAKKWFQRWRVFYIAVEELFAYNGGNEWFVGHYLFKKPAVE
ncbi:hypothetical protein AMAG_02833 [Allomyces macrogynus ATCC 38327]|uniref:Cyclopropane-fatty-acyl-phospholipid synthase n=1 Tax=Allomyces macrogynus (strain ATCC 38327) TaxID=578462 RepID=A0A0L0S3Y2_ALLM3|nr:hypothetical protein AMAG_02833 [Allomyces macrogynus ATCC 38327]|eukprot:KNE57079.1 hypothetical protein AMAG_02833 [Allomyces macrogynus ATCC 38327]